MIACQNSCDKAVQRLCVRNHIFFRVDQSCCRFDIVSELCTLLHANDITFGNLQRTVYEVDQSLGLTGSLYTNNQF